VATVERQQCLGGTCRVAGVDTLLPLSERLGPAPPTSRSCGNDLDKLRRKAIRAVTGMCLAAMGTGARLPLTPPSSSGDRVERASALARRSLRTSSGSSNPADHWRPALRPGCPSCYWLGTAPSPSRRASTATRRSPLRNTKPRREARQTVSRVEGRRRRFQSANQAGPGSIHRPTP